MPPFNLRTKSYSSVHSSLFKFATARFGNQALLPFMAYSFSAIQNPSLLRLHHSHLNTPFPRFSFVAPYQKPILFFNSSASRFTHYRPFTPLSRPRPIFSINALNSDVPHPHQGSVDIERNKRYEQWDLTTSKFAGAANIPFLLLQLPQIILNAQNLLAGTKTSLFAVSWLGMLTSLLGNLSLLSYFAKKREKEAMIVQTLGVVTTYVVLVQLAIAEAMPLPHFLATSVVVGSGLLLNFMNYFGLLYAAIWSFWEDFITVGGLSVLPQIMWSTFVPYVPNSILPGVISFAVAVVAVIMARGGKLSEEGVRFVGLISGWTATFLFMWMPISQMWTNFLKPENIRGLSAYTILLAMIGNGLLIPRALFIRDFMWFLGAAWATILYGYGNIACLYVFNVIRKEFFLAATAGLVLWIVTTFWRDAAAHGHSSPLTSVGELVFKSSK